MTLTALERRALNAADYDEGISRSDSSWYRVGEKTIADLIEKGLLERFPHPVVGDKRPMYRTTAAGKAILRQPIPKPKKVGPKIRMLKPLVPVFDPWKRR